MLDSIRSQQVTSKATGPLLSTRTGLNCAGANVPAGSGFSAGASGTMKAEAFQTNLSAECETVVVSAMEPGPFSRCSIGLHHDRLTHLYRLEAVPEA